MVMLPKQDPKRPELLMWCRWCCHCGPKKQFFKVRDGPIDWYFCNNIHAELWLEFRHNPKTYALLRKPLQERLQYLQGRSMHDEISRLFPERCDPK